MGLKRVLLFENSPSFAINYAGFLSKLYEIDAVNDAELNSLSLEPLIERIRQSDLVICDDSMVRTISVISGACVVLKKPLLVVSNRDRSELGIRKGATVAPRLAQSSLPAIVESMFRDAEREKHGGDRLKRLLIVDDEPSLREVFTEQLSGPELEVQGVSNGSEALAVLKSQPIDAVLSDVEMPIMDGLTLLAQAREQGFEVPFVILTGYSSNERIEQALSKGAACFLEKPCDLETLTRAITSALEMSAYLKALPRVQKP